MTSASSLTMDLADCPPVPPPAAPSGREFSPARLLTLDHAVLLLPLLLRLVHSDEDAHVVRPPAALCDSSPGCSSVDCSLP